MDLNGILVAIGSGCVGLVLFDLFERWWVKRSAKRFLDRLIQQGPNKEPPRLMPESLYVVQVSESGVSCIDPKGTVEGVEWGDLQAVEIHTTAAGPFLPDIFWVLHGSNSGCVISWGATGEKDLLARLQSLRGFQNEAVVNAAPSTENRTFVCWQKDPTP